MMRKSLILLILFAAAAAEAQQWAAPPQIPAATPDGRPIIATPPRIHTVYSQPMSRATEIPLYGRNKYMYFYGHENNAPEGDFAGGNIYAFGYYSVGSTDDGINMEGQYMYGSEANISMGDKITALGLGFGRKLNSKLSIEFAYTRFNGLNYGTDTRLFDSPPPECEDGEEWDDMLGECIAPEEDPCDDEDFFMENEAWCEGDPDAEEPDFGRARTLSRNNARRTARAQARRAAKKERANDSYKNRYSEDPDRKRAAVAEGSIAGYEVTGGAIGADFISAGLVYRFDDLFSRWMGGMIRPYVGVHVGLAIKSIENYTIHDPYEWTTWTDEDGVDLGIDGYDPFVDSGDLLLDMDCVQDGADDIPPMCLMNVASESQATFFGSTNIGIGYAIEAGVAIPIDNNLNLEIFAKRYTLGRVRTSGQMLQSSINLVDEFYIPDIEEAGGCIDGFDAIGDPDAPDFCMSDFSIDEFEDTRINNRMYESGNLTATQFGIKLKYFF